ncbi:hypothetical protein [Allokutzneria albata]|uniref:Pycsar effector protein domain-containing protein n=1 Tax=Allokutzneria albata TaxID=211114 RepID=A0A1G9VKM5_ALLAB|nr:hypothetical protein [Allokutzneria albata]SDM72375.1 hypothetical protein SAMN04489726_3077 [Allokutzneria albata]
MPHDPDVLGAELADVRDELKRLDGKARDLLLIATFTVTAGMAIANLGRDAIGLASTALALTALLPWTAAVVSLMLVIRPTTVPGVFELSETDLPAWRERRWQALSRVARIKLRRVRVAVDLLFATLALAVLAVGAALLPA